MSREVRRVPLDFDWPQGRVWQGYLMPDDLRLPPCPDCKGREGYSPQAWAIAGTFYPHMIGGPHADALAWCDKIGQAEVDNLLAEGRLRTLVKREPTEDNPRDWSWEALPRTADEVNAAQRGGGGLLAGHDAINRMILVRFRCETLGIPVECPTCRGHCELGTDEQHAAYEAWDITDPPTGEGWQLWETVSEGSPVTPVFPNAEMLVAHLVTVEGYRPAAAQQLVADGASAGTFIVSGGVLYDSAKDADVLAETT